MGVCLQNEKKVSWLSYTSCQCFSSYTSCQSTVLSLSLINLVYMYWPTVCLILCTGLTCNISSKACLAPTSKKWLTSTVTVTVANGTFTTDFHTSYYPMVQTARATKYVFTVLSVLGSRPLPTIQQSATIYISPHVPVYLPPLSLMSSMIFFSTVITLQHLISLPMPYGLLQGLFNPEGSLWKVVPQIKYHFIILHTSHCWVTKHVWYCREKVTVMTGETWV